MLPDTTMMVDQQQKRIVMYILFAAFIAIFNASLFAMEEENPFDLSYLDKNFNLNPEEIENDRNTSSYYVLRFKTETSAQLFYKKMKEAGYKSLFLANLIEVTLFNKSSLIEAAKNRDRTTSVDTNTTTDKVSKKVLASSLKAVPLNESLLKNLRADDAKQLPIFSTIYQCIYPGHTPDFRAWSFGEFTMKQGIDYTIVTAKFPERYHGILTPSQTAVGMMSKDIFIIAVVTPSFDCAIGKNSEMEMGNSVYKPKEIDRWFGLDREIERDRPGSGSLYDEFRAKFSKIALEDFDRIVKGL